MITLGGVIPPFSLTEKEPLSAIASLGRGCGTAALYLKEKVVVMVANHL